jgi:putative ABC transport system permease protein
VLNQASIVHAVITGPLRQNALRSVLAVCAIALGVTLGVAVNLINASAVAELSRAVQTLSGRADLVVRGPQNGFDESLYAQIARMPEVNIASPVIELDVKVHGTRDSIQVMGIDPFQSARLQPVLSSGAKERNLLQPDTVVVSADAARRLALEVGGKLLLQAGSQSVGFEVIAILPLAAGAKNLVLMDIANAQWRLHSLGRINRIDLKLAPSVDMQGFERTLQARLPAGVYVALPEHEAEQASEISRAYRVNLNMLSLVALFTGAFLVFSTQALSVLKRRSQLALMKVLGLTDRALLWFVLVEAAVLGAIGGALGILCGIFLAQIALQTVGPDLGAGYFRASGAALELDPLTLAVFFFLGLAAAAAGALVPAFKAAAIAPARALKAGALAEAPRKSGTLAGAFALTGGIAASLAPPILGLPLFGYAAVAMILLGACLFMPALLRRVLVLAPQPRHVTAYLALSRLQASPGEMALSISAILVAFSVMAAMAIMVESFRESLQNWLTQVLPADLYVRARGDATHISETEQSGLATLDGVERVTFLRYQEVRLRADRPPLTLIARDNPAALPTVGRQEVPSVNDAPPIWVSEAAADLHGFAVGEKIELPIAGKNVNFVVAGVWRDYARQTGTIAIERDLYVDLTGDALANDAWLWLASHANVSAVADMIGRKIGDQLEIAQVSELHSRSLKAFDRTFAVTYLLEAVAVVVGLFGVSASFSARVLDRRGEFGMLRHLGASRRDIAVMLGWEGGIASGLGTLLGLILGTGLSLILVFVINRQSFHWSMDLHFPWLIIAGLSAAMVLAAVLTASLSGRKAIADDMLRAVHEDW